MFRIYLRDSGEIWEWDSVPEDLHRRIKLAIKDGRWMQENFPEACHVKGMTIINLENNGFLTGIINVTKYGIYYTRVNEDDSMNTCYVPRIGHCPWMKEERCE